MFPFALTLAVAVTGYIIHRLQEHTYQGPMLHPEALTNCLRYSNTTQTYGQMLYKQAQAYFDPILNPDNLAAFAGTRGKDCDIFLQTIQTAYSSGPWARSIFKITLGINHQLKLTISAQVRKDFGVIGVSLPDANAILLESLNNTETSQHKYLWTPAHILRHEVTHAFMRIYNEKYGNPHAKNNFVNAARSAFFESVNTIANADAYNRYEYIELKLMKDRTKLIVNQMNFYPVPEDAVTEVFTHLMQMIPEPYIQKYFPFFAKHIEEMIKSFDNAMLYPHSSQLDNDIWYTPDYAIERHNYLTFIKVDLNNPYRLKQQTLKAINENDRKSLEFTLKFFQHSDTKARINALKDTNEFAYVETHLIAAQCYDYLGDHKNAYKHYNSAWEIDHKKNIKTYQFTSEQVMRMMDLRKMLEITEPSTKPPTHSMRHKEKRYKSQLQN